MPHSTDSTAEVQPQVSGLRGFLANWALLVTVYHMWLSTTRHMWAVENNMTRAPVFMIMLGADFWLTAGLLSACILWSVLLLRGPEHRRTLGQVLHRFLAADWILLGLLFLWFIVVSLVYSTESTNLVIRDWRYVLDAAVCALVLYPAGMILGVRRMRLFLDMVFQLILAFSTVFIVIAMVYIFSGQPLTLPNGLNVHLEKSGTMYIGTNSNLSAAIGMTMVCLCLYFIFAHRGTVRIVGSVLLAPHLAATFLCGSRSCYVALLIILPLAAAIPIWDQMEHQPCWRRVLFTCLAFLLVMGVVAALRTILLSVNSLRPQITPSGTSSGMSMVTPGTLSSAATESLVRDTGRFRVWHATLHLMTENPKQFFFGVPKLSQPTYLKNALVELYGAGKQMAHAHNQILQVGAIQGVPAMLVYVAFLVITAVRSIRLMASKALRKHYAIIPICLLGMVIVNMFEPFLWLYFSAMGCLFYLFCGLQVAIVRGDESGVLPDGLEK